MTDINEQPNRPYPPRTSSRFAPGVYFNFEWGVALNANDRPTHIRGVNYTSRRMQERFARDDERQRTQQSTHNQPMQLPPLPISETNFDHELNWDYRDFQQERQRRHGVRPQEQHSRGSSAPPSFERDELVSPISPLSTQQPIRPRAHASTFPRETLDRPLPYSPAHFRLGEDELPWSTPLWYRPSESEQASPPLTRASPALQSVRRHSVSQTSVASKSSGQSRLSFMGGLPSLGYESTDRQQRRSPRRRDVVPANTRAEDPQRVRDLGELHSAMIGVDGLQNDGWEAWAGDGGVGDMPRGPRSLGWAVRAEPETSNVGARGGGLNDHGNGNGNELVGFYGRDLYGHEQQGYAQNLLMSPPPTYLDSQWDMLGRRIARPRSSDDRMGMGISYWG